MTCHNTTYIQDCMQVLFNIKYFIFQFYFNVTELCVCYGELSKMRTFCDVYRSLNIFKFVINHSPLAWSTRQTPLVGECLFICLMMESLWNVDGNVSTANTANLRQAIRLINNASLSNLMAWWRLALIAVESLQSTSQSDAYAFTYCTHHDKQ